MPLVFNAISGRPRSRKHPLEPVFAFPPLWIHASAAAKCFLGKESPLLISRRREAKRRALLQMIDRLPIRPEGRTVRPLAVKVAAAPADARPATGAAPTRVQK